MLRSFAESTHKPAYRNTSSLFCYQYRRLPTHPIQCRLYLFLNQPCIRPWLESYSPIAECDPVDGVPLPKFIGERWNVSNNMVSRLEEHQDGQSGAQEASLRVEALTFVRELGMELQLGQVVLAHGQALLHTFGSRHSFSATDRWLLAAAALFLAAKAQDSSVRLSSVTAKCYALAGKHKVRRNPRLQVPPLTEGMAQKLASRLLDYEFSLLETVQFDVSFELPYDHIEVLVGQAPGSLRDSLQRVATNFCNDSFMSAACLTSSPVQIAQACVFLAARFLKVDLRLEVDERTVAAIVTLYN